MDLEITQLLLVDGYQVLVTGLSAVAFPEEDCL